MQFLLILDDQLIMQSIHMQSILAEWLIVVVAAGARHAAAEHREDDMWLHQAMLIERGTKGRKELLESSGGWSTSGNNHNHPFC